MRNTERKGGYSTMRFCIAILLLHFVVMTKGQQYGVQWVLGYRESVLDFRNDTLVNYSIGPLMPMFLTSANICDSSGNLLYYTNGIYVAGSDGNQIENGDSLSPCQHSSDNACCGLDVPQGCLFLPMPGNDRYYYLFHMSDDTINNGRPGRLYYSIIDANGNFGNGSVIQKNTICLTGIFRDGGLTACKHANGRDWWLVIGDRHNTYYKLLLNPTGVKHAGEQTIGPSYYSSLDIAYSKFSQDGSKYATGCYEGLVLIMDFDRCTGEFSSPITLFNQSCTQSTSCSGTSGLEFSPNGKYLYVSNTVDLNQYDLSVPNPQMDSIAVQAYSDNNVVKMSFIQIAPNGKTYISCFNGGFYYIHAINHPDLKGDSCSFMDTAFTTLTIASFNLPNMVNYRLGPLVGSNCDTLTDVKNEAIENRLLRVLPNPADKYLYVEMGKQGDYEFQLLNESGQLMESKHTKQIDIFNTENLPNGLYFLNALNRSNTNKIITQKVIVQH